MTVRCLAQDSFSSPEVDEQLCTDPFFVHAEALRQEHYLAVIGVQVASALIA